MIKIVMCDDDKLFIHHHQALFDMLKKDYYIECHYHLSAESLLDDQDLVESMDILFIDNYMTGLNGIQASRIVRNQNKHVKIVFLTSTSEFVFDSFDVNASNYLLKNELTDEKFITKFIDIYNQVVDLNDRRTFICKEYSKQTILDISEIIAFEVIARKTQVYTVHGLFQCYDNIRNIQSQIDGTQFYLINRSCLINMNYVKQIDKTEVHMKQGLTYQIAVKKATEFKRYFSKFLISKL